METCTAGCHQSSKVGGLVGQEESQKCPGVSVLKAHRHQKKKKIRKWPGEERQSRYKLCKQRKRWEDQEALQIMVCSALCVV